jgi:hypothetical protein
MLAIVENALADSDVSQKTSVQQEISHQRRFSLTDLIAERGEDVIMGTIGFTWVEFQEFSPMAQDNLHQAASGRRIMMTPRERFDLTMVYLISGMTLRKFAIFSSVPGRFVPNDAPWYYSVVQKSVR